MRAVVCSGFGLENASIQEVSSPAMSSEGVRISVRSIGVSFANLLVIDGKHQNKWDPPFTPGTEVAGIATECGPNTHHIRVGDRVVAGIKTGGYAQEVVAPENTVFKLPDAVSFEAAVHFPTIYATAYAALKWKANLLKNEVLLVHGAAGGSGLAAIEIGKQLGAKVIATAGSDDKAQVATEHGADLAINYRNEDFRDVVLKATQGRGANVVFDPVGGAIFDTSLRCIAPEGRIIPMGFASGKIPQIPANILLVKNITVIGLYWGYYMGWARQEPESHVSLLVRNGFQEMLEWTALGILRPRTFKTFSLENFREALEAISSREVIGRVAMHP
ncbi:NADPH:quinone reductase [Advenella sp. S44]|uniref:NADPH:quinone oxidoreductase family protein n=1 Tax=Advenella sp. S44 TaxID=1982755 RepID=UPI000C2A4F92|nr:NADPH:quinone oxidoreductase family protein [Advenella sp. S44]PJX27961.1 NADPH:quinone reductase [Advenella sp. S44]